MGCQAMVSGTGPPAGRSCSGLATNLPGALDTLFRDIRSDAPSAQVVVLGYPEFYDLSRSSGRPHWFCGKPRLTPP